MLAAGLFAQQADLPDQIFRATVNIIVVAPVTVTDRDGNYVTDLQPSDFRLFDNEQTAGHQGGCVYHPHLAGGRDPGQLGHGAVLPKVQEDRLLCFRGWSPASTAKWPSWPSITASSVLQDFTTDADLISTGFEKLKTGQHQQPADRRQRRKAIRMLARRPGNRRRVILLDQRDAGSRAARAGCATR